MLPGPDTRALRGILSRLPSAVCSGIHQLHIAFVGFRRLIHQAEYALRACQRHDDGVELLDTCEMGWLKLLLNVQKGCQPAQRKAARAEERQQRAEDGREHIAEVADVGHDGHEDIGIAVGVIGTVGQRVVQRVKPGDALILVAEYLDDLLALHHLLDIAVDRAQIALLRYEICAGPARELFGGEQHKAHHHQRQPCQRQAEGKHGAEYADRSLPPKRRAGACSG